MRFQTLKASPAHGTPEMGPVKTQGNASVDKIPNLRRIVNPETNPNANTGNLDSTPYSQPFGEPQSTSGMTLDSGTLFLYPVIGSVSITQGDIGALAPPGIYCAL